MYSKLLNNMYNIDTSNYNFMQFDIHIFIILFMADMLFMSTIIVVIFLLNVVK